VFPYLDFEIIIFLICSDCYIENKIYNSKQNTIKFYNISIDKILIMTKIIKETIN
jgi:hypothetical protein